MKKQECMSRALFWGKVQLPVHRWTDSSKISLHQDKASGTRFLGADVSGVELKDWLMTLCLLPVPLINDSQPWDEIRSPYPTFTSLSPKSLFLNLSSNFLDWIILCCGGCPMHCL